jgi:hypothetical protein
VYETQRVKKEKFKFANVFDPHVTQPSQISDNYLDRMDHALISEERLSAVIANAKDISHFSALEKAFAANFRSFSDECRLD